MVVCGDSTKNLGVFFIKNHAEKMEDISYQPWGFTAFERRNHQQRDRANHGDMMG